MPTAKTKKRIIKQRSSKLVLHSSLKIVDEGMNHSPGYEVSIEVLDGEGKPIPNEVLDRKGKPIQNLGNARTFGVMLVGLRFQTTDEVVAFAPAVWSRFIQAAPGFVADVMMHFLATVDEAERLQDTHPEELRETVDFSLDETKKLFNRYLGITVPPRIRRQRSQWTKDELEVIVRSILKPLAPQERSYALLFTQMQKLYPDRTPASAEAARKLCERLNIKARKLIKHGGKRS